MASDVAGSLNFKTSEYHGRLEGSAIDLPQGIPVPRRHSAGRGDIAAGELQPANSHFAGLDHLVLGQILLLYVLRDPAIRGRQIPVRGSVGVFGVSVQETPVVVTSQNFGFLNAPSAAA